MIYLIRSFLKLHHCTGAHMWYRTAVIVAESRRGRRIVGRLDRGQDLFSTLEAICRERDVRCGELRALGSLEAVEVAEYDQAEKRWKPGRRFASGGFEILNLTGNVSEKDGALALHAHGTFMRDRDNGVELIGGHIVSARVFALEFVIEAFDDVILRRGVDPATGLGLWRDALVAPEHPTVPVPPAPVPAPAPPPAVAVTARASSPSWEEVAAVSARKPPPVAVPTDDDGPDSVEPGDLIIHPTFGRCEVQRIEGSYEFAHVRLRNGRLVRLSLDVLRLRSAGQEEGKRVFRASVE
jgi:predicted DNA-binding protein with PD1-like motif